MAGPGTYINLNRNNAIRYSVPTTGDLPPTAQAYQLVLIEATAEVYYFDPDDTTWKVTAAGSIGTIDINSGTTGTLDLDRGGTGNTVFTPDELVAANSAGDQLESSGITAQDITTLQTDVGTLQTDVGTLQTDVINLQNDVGTLQTDVGTLQTDVGALQTDVGNLQTDVNDLENDKVDKVPMTANALVRADGTSGDIKGSDAILDDSENLTGVQSITLSGTASFLKLSPLTALQRDALTPAVGMIIFNNDTSRFEGYFDGGSGAAWGPLHGWGS